MNSHHGGAPAERVFRAAGDSATPRISYQTLAAGLVDRNHVQLSWIAGAAAVATLAITYLARAAQPEVAASHQLPLVQWTIALSILISILMIVVERFGLLRPYALLRAGLLYQVGFAAALSIFENAIEWRPDEFVRGTSSITVWLIGFALLVPAPPWLAAMFSLASAAMGPIGHIAVCLNLGLPFAPTNRLLIYYLPCFLMSAVSALINLRILRLEWFASCARERGSYELLELLSRGGMGEIWRARHRFLRRPAAVKVIRPDFLINQTARGAEVIRKRFEKEAQAIASLRSPHTVAIHDFGATEDGGFYYAMELLEGFDLDQLVKRFGPLPHARAVRVLRQACDSLKEAHLHSMVHRDIKPSNIFLCRLGANYDFCKLLDFGLVKHCLPDQSTLLTATGATTGTPAFMAPELAATNSAGPEADIYGLGCVAFWLLTGRLVFEAATPAATILAHMQKEPATPSAVSEMPIPAQLDRIILACLAKNPGDRPLGVAELDRMLAACPCDPAWTDADAESWWRTNAPEKTAQLDTQCVTQS